MPKFVIYEVWTRHRVVEAETEEMAYDQHDPNDVGAHGDGEFNVANWHVVPVDLPTK